MDRLRTLAGGRLAVLLAVAGLAGLIIAVLLRPAEGRAAAGQDWSPFVLVAGLLLIGLVADQDGLFRYAGQQLGRVARSGTLVFAGAAVLIATVTVTLNLDTSVAFLTPVLVYTARSRGAGGGDAGAALLYGCLLLSNAGSLLLPGSNLTNLIVLGHLRLTGGQFAARMWLPWLGALVVTAAVVAVGERRSLRGAVPAAHGAVAQLGRPVRGVGLGAVLLATAAVVALPAPAIPVLLLGLAAAGVRLAQRRVTVAQAGEVLSLPVLIGLFGVAVALGALGRAWSGPADLMGHLNGWATAGVAGLATVLLNNLPAASLLAARAVSHPFSLLVGLNLGPNLCVTGSLAWLLWLRAARGAGAQPSLARASVLGLVAVPLSMAVALGALALTGSA
ncbi:MAG TPA: SLC13 family permease [Streptosporangiaceae bacterium]|nr:SLC13 family permease [Streptosporangiaceae bacterium]